MKVFGDAVILCGGSSTRMGFDKSLLKINDKYAIQMLFEELSNIFENVRLCANTDVQKFSVFNIEVIKDIHTHKIGPAAAIHAALSRATSYYVFAVACDMPLVNVNHIKHMKNVIKNIQCDALVPLYNGYKQATYAFYSINCTSTFEKCINERTYKMQNILNNVKTFYLQESESKMFDKNLNMFTNLNYKKDLEKFYG